MNKIQQIFPRRGEALPPIAPVASDEAYRQRLHTRYADMTRTAFVGSEIALSVVRANLDNRLDHAVRNVNPTLRAIDTLKSPMVRRMLSFATSSPEERIEAFMDIKGLPAMEAHAELLNRRPLEATDFSEARVAIHSIAADYDGEVIEDEPESRIKVTRITTIDDEQYAVVRSKIDGLSATVNGQIDLKVRRSGAVKLSETDSEVRSALKLLGNPGYSSYEEGHPAIDAKRQVVAAYLADNPDAYTAYVQSYYLARPKLGRSKS